MSKILDFIFVRDSHVCPWWLCFTFDNIFRKLIQDPYKILHPYIKEGDTVLDVGPGMGYFTIPLAHLTGEKGHVIAADIQEKMLHALKKRAEHAGVDKRVVLHLCLPDSLGLKEKVNFVLAFWMVHEVPDKQRFLNELFLILEEKGTFLLVEPTIHVTRTNFEETVKLAVKAGFTLGERPKIFTSRAALLVKLAKNEQSEV
ncbi:MAG: class I SAM-dependent methyltransferase [Smithellaceae bacterium]